MSYILYLINLTIKITLELFHHEFIIFLANLYKLLQVNFEFRIYYFFCQYYTYNLTNILFILHML